MIAVHHHRRRDRAVPRSIAIKEPSHRPLPSRRHCAVNWHPAAPSIDVLPCRPSPLSCCPLPSICPLLSRLCRAVYCRPSPSSRRRAVHRRPPPTAVESQLRRPLLSSPSSRCCPPFITGQCPSPLCCQSLSLIRLVVAFPLVTRTPPVHRFRIFRTACSTFF